jgi:acyl-CoA thioester hydrolase
MPLTYERAFRVRHYECDPYGHVNHANYLRYMQQAAMEASAAAGYDLPRYEAMHRRWFVRETDISYLHPLVYGDTVIVKTWVEDFRRVRSRRAYQLRHADTGAIVAEATTDWVYLDADTDRPITVPPEMIAAFWPEGQPAEGPRREPFPVVPPPPPDVFVARRRVAWSDLDGAGHVNNAMYMVYLEDAGVQVAAAHTWPMARMIEAGFGIVARRYRIEYQQPALLDDELAVTTWISAPKNSSAVRNYTLTRVADGALVARAHVVWVWIDLKTGRPIRIPPEFAADFADNIAWGDGGQGQDATDR